MDLEELKFVVDTKELETAATRVAELGTAVSKLNKPMQDLTKESARTNKELSKAEEAAAKAALAQLKLEQAQTKVNETTGKSTSVLERQNMILGYMATGLSKGQASYMATAKSAGALDDELGELLTTLKTQRTLIGGDPFDKSIGLMQKLTNETKIVTEVNNLFNRGLNLTEKQMVDLAREHERLTALYNFEGKSLDGLAAEYDQIVQKTVQINQANDARTNSMKAQVKAQNDAAKANEYIAKELERVNRLTESNGDLTSATNNKLIRFEKELRASGRTAAEVTTQLDAYKAALLATQKASGNRQVDYLSRALGPQITDIAVGLATGQAPLTILLQQGGQLRDQFALAGVAGADMGKMLIQASKAMVSSIKDVGMAIGQVFVGAVTGSGKAVVNFATQITGANIVLDAFRASLVAMNGENSLSVKSFDLFGKAIAAFAGIITFVGIASLVAFGVAIGKVIKEENELNRALNLTGAAMGLNLNMAYDAARSMEQFGVSTGTALNVLTEMSKIGGLSSKSLQTIATTASALKTAFDIPIADTVKKFKELQEKPTESLSKLAAQLGTIPLEILKQVDAYERAGKSLEAAKLATDTYAKAGKDAADRTVENFGTITRLGISLGKIWSTTWESIMGIGRRDTNEEQISKLSERLSKLLAAQDPRQIQARKPMVDATIAEIKAVALQVAAEKELEEQRVKNAADAEKFADDKKKRDEAAKKAADAKVKAEKDFADELKRAKEFYNTQVGAVDNLTKSEMALAKAKESAGFKAGSPEGRKQIEQFYEQAKANELLVKAEKDRAAQMSTIDRLTGRASLLGEDYYNVLKILDEAWTDGNISLERHTELLNKLYQTTPQARAFASIQSEQAKAAADLQAQIDSVDQQYGMRNKTDTEKAQIRNLSEFRKKTAEADATMNKQIEDAKLRVTEENFAAAKSGYEEEARLRKELAQKTFDEQQFLLSDAARRQQAHATAFQDLFKGMGDAIIDFALTGKTSFGDMVQSMITGLIRLEMQMAMTNMYKAAGGSSGIIASVASIFTGTPVPSAKGNVFDGGLQAFAKGGTFTNGIVRSPTSFNMGLMGESGPEAIMPLRRGSDGSLGVAASGGSSGGNVSVQVINNSSSQATTNETVDSKGNRKIEVVIGDMTAGEISRSGSASQKSIRSTFGIQPQLIRR
jgi:lambda family phage tail tape measure protein